MRFLFADEAYGPKDKSAEGQLKRLVTEDTLRIEPKGRESFEVPNRLHVMIASNNDWVVPAGAHERRWVVQRVSEIHRQEDEWFKPLYAEMKSGGLAAMLYDLLRVDWATGTRARSSPPPRSPSNRTESSCRRSMRGGSRFCTPANWSARSSMSRTGQ